MESFRIDMAASNALEHYRAAFHCSIQNGATFGASQLMLAAFSAELAMKALIYKYGGTCKKHELKKLLDKLQPDFKHDIETVLKNEWDDYDDQLLNANSSFVDWRYVFEKEEPMTVNINFIMRLAELCCLIVKREFQIEEYILENGEKRINPLPSINKN